MDCLICSQCQSPYSQTQEDGHLPRILACGHTFCQPCLSNQLIRGFITCFRCCKAWEVKEISSLPINEIVFAIPRSSLSTQHLCKVHKKRLEAFCQKDKELICFQCNQTTHRFHKICFIEEKVRTERNDLKECLPKIMEGVQQYRKLINKLKEEQSTIESTFLDFQVEISIFYKSIMEEISALKEKEIQRLRVEKEQLYASINTVKNEVIQKLGFFQNMQSIYDELSSLSDVEFLKNQNKQAFIQSNCKFKRDKLSIGKLEFRRVVCLQEIINSLQDIANLEKKRVAHSSSLHLSKDQSLLHNSPSLKKSKEPAVLEVNLSEQYNKRKVVINGKKAKPTKKVINISTNKDREKQKEKIIEAVTSGKVGIPLKDNKGELKFLRESSIKKSRQAESVLLEEYEDSNNMTPMSINSFMNTSRQSHNNHSCFSSSFKQSFNQFSLLEFDERVYHFGGRVQTEVERYSLDSDKSELVNCLFNRKGSQSIYYKSYAHEKCLILGGVPNNQSQQLGTDIYEYNFKTEKIAKTLFQISHSRTGFGCLTKDQSFFIFGGRHEKPLNSFERYVISAHKLVCSKLPAMTHAREDLGFCLGYDGYIYVAGGVNTSNNILNSCERFNFEKNAWEAVPHMKNQRRSFAMVAVPQGIFAIGGHSSVKLLDSVEFFSFNTKQWVDVNPLLEARCYHTAVASRDYRTITVFGGLNGTNELDSIEMFSTDSSKWEKGGRMRAKRVLHCSVLCPL